MKGVPGQNEVELRSRRQIPALMQELGPVIGLMFCLGNRSGLRTGVITGLRSSDLGL
jgi:hypothetical protein